MKFIITLLLLFAFFISCNSSETKNPDAETLGTIKKESDSASLLSSKRCYQTNTNNNEVTMSLQITDNLAAGDLIYGIAGKDKNQGTFSGRLAGDTLTAEYTFMSEGIESVRQIKYLISDSLAMEGYGKMEERNGKMIFSDDAKPEFGKGIVLNRVSCSN